MDQLPTSFTSFRSKGQARPPQSRGNGPRYQHGRGGRGRGRGARSRGHNSSGFSHGNSNDFFARDDLLINVEEVGEGGNCIRLAVQGCCHGNLDSIYETLQVYKEKNGKDINLLLCCGDFQALRNTTDYETMAVPPKYRDMGSFYKYYAGMKTAPVLTIFVGGNHEASSYLQELYYGGWVAPNIYYLGAAGVVRYGNLRIAGISGIYKHHDYRMGRHESPPYNNSTLRSVYHVRNVDVARLQLLTNRNRPRPKIQGRDQGTASKGSTVDIMLSHDWPRGIEQHGNTELLIRKKKFFRQEIQENNLGSPSNEVLLHTLQPKWWFAAHLHVKFTATFRHLSPSMSAKSEEAVTQKPILIPSSIYTSKTMLTEDNKDQKPPPITENTNFIALESTDKICEISGNSNLTDLMTQFLSLDKCLPKKHHLQIVNMPALVNDMSGSPYIQNNKISSDPNLCLEYDLEWLAILKKTHHWTKTSKSNYPDPVQEEISILDEDIDAILEGLKERLQNKYPDGSQEPTIIPNNFTMTLQPHGTVGSEQSMNGGRMVGNPQTDELVQLLGIEHVITVPYIFSRSLAKQFIRDDGICTVDKLKSDENEIDLDGDSDEEVQVGSNGIGLIESDRDRSHEVSTTDFSTTATPGGQEDADEIDLDDI